MYQTIDKLAERKVTSIESLKKAGITEKQLVDWLLASRGEFMKKGYTMRVATKAYTIKRSMFITIDGTVYSRIVKRR